jgi:hypothetical protein
MNKGFNMSFVNNIDLTTPPAGDDARRRKSPRDPSLTKPTFCTAIEGFRKVLAELIVRRFLSEQREDDRPDSPEMKC